MINNELDVDMMEVSLNYWFTDNDAFRTPFPDYIKGELRDQAVNEFTIWFNKLKPEAKKEINDEILLEKFEEILFEVAHKMVITDDERITVKYPFMLRIGDTVRPAGKNESIVTAREIYLKDDISFLKVELKEKVSGVVWETSFDLFE